MKENINLKELNELFSKFGKINEINNFWKSQHEDCFLSVIKYYKEEDAQKAKISLNGAELDGKILKISLKAVKVD